METLEELKTMLIHADDHEIAKLTSEARTRQNLLNSILELGFHIDDIHKVSSKDAINEILFRKMLTENRAMAKEHAAGKKKQHLMEAYQLPGELYSLKDALEDWINYPTMSRGYDKFTHLVLVNNRYQLSPESLEREFDSKRLKVYATGQNIDRIQRLEALSNILEVENAYWPELVGTKFFNDRLTRDSSQACNKLPVRKFMIKRSFLNGHM